MLVLAIEVVRASAPSDSRQLTIAPVHIKYIRYIDRKDPSILESTT